MDREKRRGMYADQPFDQSKGHCMGCAMLSSVFTGEMWHILKCARPRIDVESTFFSEENL